MIVAAHNMIELIATDYKIEVSLSEVENILKIIIVLWWLWLD